MSVSLPIRHVTVHPDGAIVVREGPAEPQGGAVVVEGLPFLLDVASVRVTVDGGRLVAASLGLASGPERGESVDVQAALFDAEAALAEVVAELAALGAEREAMARLVPTADSESAPPSAAVIAGWAAMQGPMEDWATSIDARRRQLEVERDRLQEDVQRAKWTMAASSDDALWARWMPARQLRVEVEGTGPLTLRVSYRIDGATWTPAYRIDADEGFTAGRFAMRALIAQATGESWVDVALTLSTVASRREVQLPELPALRLGSRSASRTTGFRPLPDHFDALFPGELKAMAEEPPELVAQPLAEPSPVPSNAVAPVAQPPPAPVVAMSARSLPPKAKKRSVMAMDFGGGGPPESAPPASRPAAAAPAEGDDRIDARDGQLDYGALRMVGALGGARRGRLKAQGLPDQLRSRGVPMEGVRAVLSRCAQLRAAMTRVADVPLPPHHQKAASTVESNHAVPGQASIASDGRLHAVSVWSTEVRPRSSWICVPRHDPRVFRRVTALPQGTHALLPGPVDVVVDGGLVLTAPWKGRGGGTAELEIDAGVDDRFRVARNVRYAEASAGFFGGRRRMTTTVDVEIVSAADEVAEIEVRERIPVASAQLDVMVERLEESPAAEALNDEPGDALFDGRVRQRLTVAAKGQARCTLSYAITMSDKDEIVGGDRRG